MFKEETAARPPCPAPPRGFRGSMIFLRRALVTTATCSFPHASPRRPKRLRVDSPAQSGQQCRPIRPHAAEAHHPSIPGQRPRACPRRITAARAPPLDQEGAPAVDLRRPTARSHVGAAPAAEFPCAQVPSCGRRRARNSAAVAVAS